MSRSALAGSAFAICIAVVTTSRAGTTVDTPVRWNSPWQSSTLPDERSNDESTSHGFLTFPLKISLLVFRRYVSPVDGHRCTMRPSCSGYALEAMETLGLARGILAAADRLHRCGHDLNLYEIRHIDEGNYYYDPPVRPR